MAAKKMSDDQIERGVLSLRRSFYHRNHPIFAQSNRRTCVAALEDVRMYRAIRSALEPETGWDKPLLTVCPKCHSVFNAKRFPIKSKSKVTFGGCDEITSD